MYDLDDFVSKEPTDKITIGTLEELFISNRIGRRASPHTIVWYESMFKPFNKYLMSKGIDTIGKLNNIILDNYIRSLLNHKIENRAGRLLSESAVHGHARAIRALILFAQRRQYMPSTIFIEMPKVHKKENRVLTKKEVYRLIEGARTLREKAAIALAVDSGLRISELASLRWKDIDTRTSLIKVLHGKGDKYRVVAAGGKTISLLLQLKQSLKFNTPMDGVFQSHLGTPLTRWGMRSLFEDLSQYTGIPFSAHALRRTCAKFSIQNGMDIVMVQQLLGHENVETTRRYIQDLDATYILESHKKHGVIDHL